MFNRWAKIKDNVVEEIYYAKPDDEVLKPQDGVEFMIVPLFVEKGYFINRRGSTLIFTPPRAYMNKAPRVFNTIERKQI